MGLRPVRRGCSTAVKPHRLGNHGFDDSPLQVRAHRKELSAVGILVQHFARGEVRSDSLPDDGYDVTQETLPSLRPVAEVEAASTIVEAYPGIRGRAISSRLPGSCHVARLPCAPRLPTG